MAFRNVSLPVSGAGPIVGTVLLLFWWSYLHIDIHSISKQNILNMCCIYCSLWRMFSVTICLSDVWVEQQVKIQHRTVFGSKLFWISGAKKKKKRRKDFLYFQWDQKKERIKSRNWKEEGTCRVVLCLSEVYQSKQYGEKLVWLYMLENVGCHLNVQNSQKNLIQIIATCTWKLKL